MQNKDQAKYCVNCGMNLAASSQPEQNADPFIGTTLDDKFLILDHIGDGGMGKVYKAEQLSLNKIVAVKILNQELLGNDTQVKRFQREAWSASRLNHPHSIAIIDFGCTAGNYHYIAMEYLEGQELSEVIEKHYPLRKPRVVKIMGQVLSVLHTAHQNKIVHRDLKPENIMLINVAEEEDFVKVLDFGIAKLTERTPDMAALTMEGIVCGTPEYMSPEQALGKDLDARTDIYSAGCILYEMLTGEVPFWANNYQAILGMHIRDVPRSPSQVVPERGISKQLEQVLLKAMEKNPKDRFQTALEMKAALELTLKAATEELAPSQEVKQAGAVSDLVNHLQDLPVVVDATLDETPEPPSPSGFKPGEVTFETPDHSAMNALDVDLGTPQAAGPGSKGMSGRERAGIRNDRHISERPEAVGYHQRVRTSSSPYMLQRGEVEVGSDGHESIHPPYGARRILTVAAVTAAAVIGVGVYSAEKVYVSNSFSEIVHQNGMKTLVFFATKILPLVLMIAATVWIGRFCLRRLVGAFGPLGGLIPSFAGTASHKLFHAAACLLGQHRILDPALTEPDPRTGSFGFVRHAFNSKSAYPRDVGNALTALLPLSGGIALLYALAALLDTNLLKFAGELFHIELDSLENGAITEYWPFYFKQFWNHLFAADTLGDLSFWLFAALSASVALHLKPARRDYEIIWGPVLIVLIVLSGAYMMFGMTGLRGWEWAMQLENVVKTLDGLLLLALLFTLILALPVYLIGLVRPPSDG